MTAQPAAPRRAFARVRAASRGIAQSVASVEALAVLALAPLLVFPRPRLTPWLMALVPLLWLCRWLARGRLTIPMPLDWPLVGVMAAVGVSLWATFDPALSFPKVCGVFLGIALFFALANTVHTRAGLRITAALLLLGGAMTAGLVLIGTRWRAGKVPLLAPLLALVRQRIPQLVRGIPRAEAGFNANQAGGTLTLFVPLAGSLLLHCLRLRRRSARWALTAWGLGVVLLLVTSVLLLTQSRQAYVAVTLAGLLLGASHGRWTRLVAAIILAAGAVAVATAGVDWIAGAVVGAGEAGHIDQYGSWTARVEIWERGLRVIRDHPLTGIGFDTFFPLVHGRYPTFLIAPGTMLGHAHNLYLQTALDLGLPGLAAFLWFLGAWCWMLWQVWRKTESDFNRALAAGLLLGMLAQLLFGLADAIALGQKPGAFTWSFLGLGAALWVAERMQQEGSEPSAPITKEMPRRTRS